MDERDRYENGLAVRRAVLGDAHVDRSLAKRDGFNEEFQALITRYAWGEIWTRPGLARHTRSLLTLGLMVALNRSDSPQGAAGLPSGSYVDAVTGAHVTAPLTLPPRTAMILIPQ